MRKGERGKEEGRDNEEEECKQVEKDVTGWTEVTKKKKRKTVQIFVKVNESKAFPDVMRQVQKVEDAYVTMQGKVLRGNEKLKSCGVTDGCAIQVTSRMRGGGRHKDKKSKSEKKQTTNSERPEQKLEEELKKDKGLVIQECDNDTDDEESEESRKVMVGMLEENEDNLKMFGICVGSDVEVEQALQNCWMAGREVLGWDQGQADLMERGLGWAVEARRKERRQQEEEQAPRTGTKQGKQVGFGEEEQVRETRATSTDEPEVMARLAKGSQQSVKEKERGRVAPNMGQVAHTPRPRRILERKKRERRHEC